MNSILLIIDLHLTGFFMFYASAFYDNVARFTLVRHNLILLE
jgi:hypothetical protein